MLDYYTRIVKEGTMQTNLSYWSELLVRIGLNIVAAIVLWIVGRWLINLAVGLIGKAFERGGKIDATLANYLKSIIAIVLVVVGLILLGINLTLTPHRLWILWVLGGWGIGLVLHAFRVFGPAGWLDATWEKQQVEKRLGRPL